MASPHEGGPELVHFPRDCELVAVLNDSNADITPGSLAEIVSDLHITVDDDVSVLPVIGDRTGMGSLDLVEAVEAGESDCDRCGGRDNPERATICSLGALFTRILP